MVSSFGVRGVRGNEPAHGSHPGATSRCLQKLSAYHAISDLAGRPAISIGIGVNRAPVGIGMLGGTRRCYLTTLGNTVNVTARIESLTRKLPRQTVVEGSLFEGEPDVWREPASVTYSLRDLGEHSMKNIARPARLYGLAPLVWREEAPSDPDACRSRGNVRMKHRIPILFGNAAAAGGREPVYPLSGLDLVRETRFLPGGECIARARLQNSACGSDRPASMLRRDLSSRDRKRGDRDNRMPSRSSSSAGATMTATARPFRVTTTAPEDSASFR